MEVPAPPSSQMAEADARAPAPPSPHCTRPSNTNKHPANILKAKRKRRTKAEKAVNEKQLKEAWAAKAKAAKEGIEELVAMEVEAEARETEA